jgi:hypothetical protein
MIPANDTWALGLISVDDVKNVFTELIKDVEAKGAMHRWDLVMDDLDCAKAKLIQKCERNAKLFSVKPR